MLWSVIKTSKASTERQEVIELYIFGLNMYLTRCVANGTSQEEVKQMELFSLRRRIRKM